MAIGGSPPGAPRAKDGSRDGSKGAAGRFAFVVEVARGYLGALWLAHDGADTSDAASVFVRHVAPLVATSARAAILEGAKWSIAGAESGELELIESRSAVDLVTPFVDGEILRALLRTAAVKHATIEPPVLFGVARDLVGQLVAIHERALSTKAPQGFGGVHPDSIVVDVEGRVHLLDAGAGSAAASREPWRSDPQRVGYFAPEQTETRGVIDARTDVFAVGILLWEALANRRLFPGNDAKTARERVQKASVTRLDATRSSASPAIATDIADVVARCLERDPAARFQSMSELAEAIDALDVAAPEHVGAWVTTLSDAAIGKRRQFRNRAAAGQLTGEERLSLPPPSVGRRPSETAARPSSLPATRPSTLPRAPAVPVSLRDRPSAVPPVATKAARDEQVAATGSATATPISAGAPAAALVAPRTGGTLPGPSELAEARLRRSAAQSVAPSPPSARAAMSGAPPAPSMRASATSTPLAGPAPPPNAVSATSTPVVGTPALPANAAGAVTAPDLHVDATPHAPPAVAPPAEAAEAESLRSQRETLPDPARAAESTDAPRARADSAEAIEPEDDSVDEDVEDDGGPDELGAPSKRPPPLPHEEGHLPLAGLAGLGEPLARPVRQSELAGLTARSIPVGLPRSVVAAALVSLLALGGFVVIRWRAHARASETPQIERTVQTPPVRIEEPLRAVPPEPSAPPHAEVPAPPVESAVAVPAAPAPEKTPPPSDETPPSMATVEKPRPRPPTPSGETPHRASHDTSGFKPGGI